jgi:hypothetical protein
MLEGEETKWRLGVEPEQAEERAAELSSEEDEQKEELQQTIQARADEIGGGGGEGSVVAEPAEEPIADAPKDQCLEYILCAYKRLLLKIKEEMLTCYNPTLSLIILRHLRPRRHHQWSH